VGIWLAGDYANSNTYVRIPCINDHRDAELTTTRQMCRMFALIRLNLLPSIDATANTLMQHLLHEPNLAARHRGWTRADCKPLCHSSQSLRTRSASPVSDRPTTTPMCTPEGLIIKWNNTAQIDSFNKRNDPGNADASTHLTGEIAVCWQNLLADNRSTGFDGIVDVINNFVSDFLDQRCCRHCSVVVYQAHLPV
jgi:hypothetical protein